MVSVSPIINQSGFRITPHRYCPALKSAQWFAINKTMTGDAPKDFIAIYEYGADGCRKSKKSSWPTYIAKVGHKWYPNESIAEHLVTRIGQRLGIIIADSRLVHVRGQLRFLSRYFLRKDEYLLHGADIFASYLDDDEKEFMDEVEEKGLSPETFDYDFAVESIREMLPDSGEEVIRGFNKMLAFDTLVGNNDRHFYNWAVICNSHNQVQPRFSPIFDTARALFWNHSEQTLYNWEKQGNVKDKLRKYCKNSNSKIGVKNKGQVNHFDLLDSIIKSNPDSLSDINILSSIDQEPVDFVEELLKGEFKKLISPLRRNWICRLIEYRTELFRSVIDGDYQGV